MPSSLSTTAAGRQRAITDVYDEERHFFLLQYPVPVVVGLALVGLTAFALAGFFGYPAYVGPSGQTLFVPLRPWDTTFFHEPWLLFAWFCALIMALEASILRDRRLRLELIWALSVTVISMIIVTILYFYSAEIQQFLQQLIPNFSAIIPRIGNNPSTYTIINFGILAIFGLDTVRRWVRVATGKPLTRGVDIGIEREDRAAHDAEHPGMDELISGDLIAGAVLALVLALVFRAGVINAISGALQTRLTVTTCTLSWPIGHCAQGGTVSDPPSLFFMDLLQSLIYLPLGLLVLALTATIAGLGAAGGVEAPVGTGRVRAMTQSVPVAHEGDSAAGNVGTEVAQTLFDTLKTALNRRVRFAAGNFALSVRNILWPVLVFIATFSVAAGASEIQKYLHVQSEERTCGMPGYLSCSAVHSIYNSNLPDFAQPLTFLAFAAALGAVAVLAITLAMALLVFRWRVAENTFRFLGLIGLIVLLTFWIFSLTLSAFNGLLWLLNHNVRWPFPQPGAGTIISLAAFLGWGVYLLVTRRQRQRGAATPITAPTGARSRNSSGSSSMLT